MNGVTNKGYPWSLKVQRPAAEHFVTFLYNTHYLKDDYSLSKKELHSALHNEYQPRYHWNKPPFGIISLLLRCKLVKKARTDQDLNILVFNADKVISVITKLNTSSKDGGVPPLDERLSQPVETVFVNQQSLFRPKQQKTVGVSHLKCDLCHINFKSQAFLDTHKSGELHILRETYRDDKKKLASSKTVSVHANQNTTALENVTARAWKEGTLKLTVSNSSHKRKHIDDVIPLVTLPEVKMVPTKLPIIIEPQGAVSLQLEYKFVSVGSYMYPIVFKVRRPVEGDYSYVLKEIVFDCQSEVMDELGPTSQFKWARPSKFKVFEGPIVSGVPPPPTKTGLIMERPLPQFAIPDHLKILLNHQLKSYPTINDKLKNKLEDVKDLLGLSEEMKTITRCVLQPDTYCDIFSTLLHIEEHQMNIDIRNYDCDGKVLNKVKGTSLLSLEVPGLAENRPSVLKGDSIYVIFEGDTKMVRYEGRVHNIRETDVHLGLHDSFHRSYVDGKKLHVQFKFCRYPLQVEHRALQILRNGHGVKYMLPKEHGRMRKQIVPIRVWKNRNIENNEQQKIAVTNIVNNSAYPAPYIVFGPPGTGKTVTIVEAIAQLWDLQRIDSKQHILVCAPSNAAADVVALRLLNYIPESAILRLYASSRPYITVPELLRNSSNFDERGSCFYSTKDNIMKFPIVVVTLVTAAKLVGAGFPTGHFSHLFVDECGHAVEPEVLVPIAGLLLSDQPGKEMSGQIVLAGDPKQLGPMLRSPLAVSLGLGTSFLERLMEDEDLYKRSPLNKQYNSAVLTKLVKNYRSHGSILAVPNNLFYENELQVCGGPEISLACSWEELPKKNFPVIFHGVQGKDNREANSPSYFNIQEIDVIFSYLNKLFEDRLNGRKIRQSDIGIVTPYRKQVEKIRAALEKKNWTSIDVGSVEQFQGQERLIIIISTVRSTQKLVQDDYKFQLGFLKNPKRMNVALTRAKALLVVVGNPNILQCDSYWRAFIKYCQNNGAYRGIQFTPISEEAAAVVDDITKDLENMCLNPGEASLQDDGPNWRGDM